MKNVFQRFIKAFRMNGQVKKRTLTIIGILAVIVLLVILLISLLRGAEEPEIVPTETDVEPEPEEIIIPRIDPEPITEPESMDAAFEKYEDVYAWIEMPSFSELLGNSTPYLSYPVAQCSRDIDNDGVFTDLGYVNNHINDNDYYLEHTLDGVYQPSGPAALYTDYSKAGKRLNHTNLNDPVTVIYGHNMANRTMFGGLRSYMQKYDFNDPQYVYLYQQGRRITYEIVGGVLHSNEHVLYEHDFDDPDVFNTFFEELWASQHDYTHVDRDKRPVAGDRVLIMLLCVDGDVNHEHRYLVVCRMIEDTMDEETWDIDVDALKEMELSTNTIAELEIPEEIRKQLTAN